MSGLNIKPFVVVTGHYGTGKTNFCINLALDFAERYDTVTVVDLDIVNLYFRISDYTDLLAAHGVRVIAPVFAGTTVDTPSLSAAVFSAFEAPGAVVFDVGGDDVGATALGQFRCNIEPLDYDMLYVVNRYRNLTATPAEAINLLREIERASRLRATGIVNNSHLKAETTVETVLDSAGFAREVADELSLPLKCTTIPQKLAKELSRKPKEEKYLENAYPVKNYVCTQWEDVQ